MGLTFDTGRLPADPFNVLCPRCRQSVTVMPPPKQEPKLHGAPADQAAAGSANPDPLRGLAELLSSAFKHQPQQQRIDLDKWQRRRMLFCVEDVTIREKLRSALDPARYEVTVAESANEAIELFHDSRSDVLVLSPGFDPDHQGGAAMMMHVGKLTAQQRRRTYLVLVSPQLRTLDTYLAFANGANLTVHPEDADSFQSIFDRSIRDFNELYRPHNQATGTDPF
jgi:CheY-like chemotaxis protein